MKQLTLEEKDWIIGMHPIDEADLDLFYLEVSKHFNCTPEEAKELIRIAIWE